MKKSQGEQNPRTLEALGNGWLNSTRLGKTRRRDALSLVAAHALRTSILLTVQIFADIRPMR